MFAVTARALVLALGFMLAAVLPGHAQSYEQALAVAREAGLEDQVRPLVEIRFADLDRLAGEADR